MAKRIQLSSDGGSTWNTFPGSGGSFNANGEQIDDTILGQSFSSALTGLIAWGVSTDGIFKGFAGYLAELKENGTPVTVTDEPMAQESGLIYAVVDTTREIWDRSAGVVVNDDGSPVAAADIEWIDFLFGRVKFVTGYTVAGAVTVDVDYIPTSALGKGQTYTLTMTSAEIDETDFATAQGNSGHRVYRPGLRTVALELGGFFDPTVDMKSKLTNREEVIIEVDPAGDGSTIFRGFFRLADQEQSGDVGALEEETVNFTLNVPDEEKLLIPFSVKHTNTTLNQGIQDAINSWLNELNTYDVRYLPQGAIGQTPNDGIEGNVMFSNISLSGGLSNMNVFQIEMMGTGEYSVV